ncbi:condensin complex subunit 3-like isoform X2 [Xenia sp. Carnegie-2017]|uniref:condensin complex subunit 3-like isoform X2 n=1 Tax=Xenia sp. Carnegie-2017 TaxID=2897299 RepID=UPI001F049365|nr:condensin complex subunit 3-like isoform X2 [Xenia sp. Carnegie-2017]
MKTFSSVKEVFNAAQTSSQHQATLFKALDKLLECSESSEIFVQDFIHNLKYCMIVFQKEPAVERLIDFIATYATRQTTAKGVQEISKAGDLSYTESSDEEDSDPMSWFLLNLMNFLLEVHDSRDKAVRYRTCQLISKIFNYLDDEASINQEIADGVLTSMMNRLLDKIPTVRSQAILALSRLQDPSDPKCPVIEVFLYMMQSDNSADVRKTAMQCIAITNNTLQYLLERTRDVKDSVRKCAFQILGHRVGIRALTIAQRVKILHDGLNDRVESVKQACYSKLLLEWMKQFCNNSIPKLLALLDVENSLKTSEIVVNELLKAATGLSFHIDTLKEFMKGQTVLLENLNCERALFWQCLVGYCVSLGTKGQSALDEILPEISEFCQYIESYIDKCSSNDDVIENKWHEEFALQQLLTIAAHMDLSDEVGRKKLKKLFQDMMINPQCPVSLIPIIHERYSTVEPDEEKRIIEIAEVIADIREPITVVDTPRINEDNRARELKLAGVRVKINQLRDDMENFVSAQEFDKAADVKRQLCELEQEKSDLENEANHVNKFQTRIEKDDAETLAKCLRVASGLVRGIIRSSLNHPTPSTLVETLILPGVQNEEPLVREVAVECLGLCSLLSRDFASRHLVLFLQIVLLDVDEVKISALKSILDLLQVYGLETFKVTPAEQAIVEAEQSVLEPENENHDDDDDDEVSDGEEVDCDDEGNDNNDDNGGEEGSGSNGEGSDDNNAEKVDEAEVIINEAQKSVSHVLYVLIKCLEKENPWIRCIAAEGFAKLMLSGRVHSPKVFSRLLILWYNPLTEDDPYLRESIGVFMSAFAFDSRSNQEQIADAVLPTLRTLFNAPTSSPLAQIDVANVAELLVHLTSTKCLDSGSGNSNDEDSVDEARPDSIHGGLALKIANEIITTPFSPGVRVLCKALTLLNLTNAKENVLKDLVVLCEKMLKEIEDAQSGKYIAKFQKSLSLLRQ